MPDPDMFPKLTGHRYFTKIDLSKGYWQVELTDSAKPKTAFRTGKGLFQFKVMPFGLVTVPATFSRLMRKVLYKDIRPSFYGSQRRFRRLREVVKQQNQTNAQLPIQV